MRYIIGRKCEQMKFKLNETDKAFLEALAVCILMGIAGFILVILLTLI